MLRSDLGTTFVSFASSFEADGVVAGGLTLVELRVGDWLSRGV